MNSVNDWKDADNFDFPDNFNKPEGCCRKNKNDKSLDGDDEKVLFAKIFQFHVDSIPHILKTQGMDPTLKCQNHEIIEYRNGNSESSVICQYVCQSVLFVQPTRSFNLISMLVHCLI